MKILVPTVMAAGLYVAQLHSDDDEVVHQL